MEKDFVFLSYDRTSKKYEKPIMKKNPENPELISSDNNLFDDTHQEPERSADSISSAEKTEEVSQEKMDEKQQLFLEQRLSKLLISPENRIRKLILITTVSIMKAELIEYRRKIEEKDEAHSENERAKILETIRKLSEDITNLIIRRILQPILVRLLAYENRKRLEEVRQEYTRLLSEDLVEKNKVSETSDNDIVDRL